MGSYKAFACGVVRSVLFLLLSAVVLIPAQARANVSQPAVSLSSNVVSDQAVYTVSFTLGTTLPNGGSFVVTFPTGTDLGSLLVGDVRLTNVTNGGSQRQAATLALSGATLTTLTIGKGNWTARANDVIQLQIGQSDRNMVVNPSLNSLTYTLQVNTSVAGDATPVTSATYMIVPAQMSPADVTLSNPDISAYPNVQFSFQTSKTVQNGEYFQIVFPTGTTLSKPGWAVNGIALNQNRITITGMRLSVRVTETVSPGIFRSPIPEAPSETGGTVEPVHRQYFVIDRCRGSRDHRRPGHIA